MAWTDEMVERIRVLIVEKKSASEIAVAINTEFGTSYSRNAIIGKAHRVKLPSFQGYIGWPPVRKAAGSAAHIAKRGRSRPKIKRLANHGNRFVVVESNAPSPMASTPADDLEIPACQRRTMMTLTSTTCRWPVGDPAKADFFFCGALVEPKEVYCSGHCDRARRDDRPLVLPRRTQRGVSCVGRRRACPARFRG